jgi:FkbM family methyltransferase
MIDEKVRKVIQMLEIIRRRLRSALEGTRAFVPVRNLYRQLFHRHVAREAKAMRRFYRQFFQAGDIVFDVGANIGDYAEAFSDLGGRVIAIDPNPDCADPLQKLARIRDIKVERCAIGDRPGTATINLCQFSHFATLNNEFLEQTKGSPDYKGVTWKQQVEVPLVTLDQLAVRYGLPTFVKIDVEGYEDKVISGMSFRPNSISFEFSPRSKDIAFRALSGLDGYEFNAVAGRSFNLLHARWMSRNEIIGWIDRYNQTSYGDIFGRRIA